MATLDELLTPPTAADVRANMLSSLEALGFPVTSWEPDGVANSIIETASQIIAAQAAVAVPIAAGGFLDTAAAIKTATGADDPAWITLLAQNLYGVTPTPATTAAGTVSLSNANGTPIVFGAGDLRLANLQGYTYTSIAAVTVPAGGSSHVDIVADQPGASGSAAPGTLAQVAPIAGLSVTNPAALVGSDGESNASIAARCRARLATLSPNGPAAAYDYFSRLADDGAGSVGVTRVVVLPAPGTGAVNIYIQNAAGTLDSTDAAGVLAYLLKTATPDTVTPNVTAAALTAINVTATVYAASAGVTSAACKSALSSYLLALPLGGVEGAAPNVAPLSGMIGALQSVAGVTAVVITAVNGSAAADVPLMSGGAPLAASLSGSSAITVVPV